MPNLLPLVGAAVISAPVLFMPTSTMAQDDVPVVQEETDRPSRGRGAGRGEGSQGGGRMQGKDPLSGRISVGSSIPGFSSLTAHKPDGSKVTFAELVPEDGHLVIVTGCLTCPKFLMSHRDIEAVAHDYRNEDMPVAFVYVYKSLAHPENGGWIQPFTLEERLAQVGAAQEQLKTKVPFVCDDMENRVSSALGGSPNSSYIVNEKGKIAFVSGWADGESLRSELVKLVGPTKVVSTPGDIGVPSFERPYRNTGTVVPRVEVTGTMIALQTEPAESEHPHYVKLRVEVEPSVLSGRAGRLYLGFHLDPVHGVHWNNLVEPVSWSLKHPPEKVKIDPATGIGPRVEPQTDSDPREFLLDVESWGAKDSIEITVRYFACSEKEGWCKPVTQVYIVKLERDPAGGMAQSRWKRGGEGGDGGQVGRGGGMADADPLARMDTDGDGKIAQSEAPGPMKRRFSFFDTDGDGYISGDELDVLKERMQRRSRGGAGGRGDRGSSGGGRQDRSEDGNS